MRHTLRWAAVAALLIALVGAFVNQRWSKPADAAGANGRAEATDLRAVHALSERSDEDDNSGSGGGGGDNSGSGSGHDDDDGGDEDDAPVPVTGEIPAGSLVVRIIDDDAFTPSTLTVDPGQSITFVNEHDDEHTATGSGFDTGVIPPGGTATVALDEPGTFAFACQFHPEMTGSIGVRGPDGTVPPPSQAAPPPADATAVTIANLAFGPASITVPVGTTVAWTNADSLPHTVTAADGTFDSGIFDPGASFSWTFTEPGTFAYQCNLHPQMQGTVIVTGEASAAVSQAEAGSAADATPIAADVPARLAFDAMNEALATGDTDALEAVFAADYVGHTAGDDQASDRQGLKDRLADLRDRSPGVEFRVEDVVDGGGKAAVRYTLRTVSIEDPSATPSAATTPTTEGTIILRVEGGLVVESWDVLADGDLLAQATEESLATPTTASPDDTTDAAPAAVTIVDFAFDPSTLEIATGATVTWTNGGVAPHTATAEGGSFDSGQLAAGQTFSQTFDAAGDYAYLCNIHPSMTGTVVVR